GKGRISRDNKPRDFTGDPDLGYFVWPAIWGKVDSGMKLAQQEVFGPVVSLIEVDDIDEALAFMPNQG
ncbi:MAG TPA: aldehyde dehydrogenase family protein, partial [Candidatus Obscuribacterales bacterium]